MSTTITTANGEKIEHPDGNDLQVNDDGTLVVFGPPKQSASSNKNRIAMYAPGHWSNAAVEQGPSKVEQVVEYISKQADAYREKHERGEAPIKVEDWNSEIAVALYDLGAEIALKIISPPKVERSNPIDREAMLRMEREQAAAEAGRKGAGTRLQPGPPNPPRDPRDKPVG